MAKAKVVRVCTPESPYSKYQSAPGVRWRHTDVSEVDAQEGGWPSRDAIRYRCNVCGVEWKEELPQ